MAPASQAASWVPVLGPCCVCCRWRSRDRPRILGGEGRCDALRAAEPPGSSCIGAFASWQGQPGSAVPAGGEGMSVRCRALRAVAVVSILVAACGGRSGAALAPGPVTASLAVPAQRAAVRVPRAAALGAAGGGGGPGGARALPAGGRRRRERGACDAG